MKYIDFLIPANVDIFQDMILFVSWRNPVGFLIKSNELADSFREYFKEIWKKAKN